MPTSPDRPNLRRAWFLLFRPWSYTATLVPFLVAAGVGARDPTGLWWRWAVGLVAGILFQATVNLLNTWGDERSGVDDAPGAIRTTPQVHDGLVSMNALLAVALACAALAAALGLSLCFCRHEGAWRIDTPLLAAGFIGFLGSTNYSTGVRFKYRGLGVPFVSFLMGPLETFVALALLKCGLAITSPSALANLLLLSLPVAALVGVILHGNDMRDIPSDRAAGIVTFASWLGPKNALRYYLLCHVLPYAIVGVRVLFLAIFRTGSCVHPYWGCLPLLALPLSVRTMRAAAATCRSCPENPPWRGLERASGAVLLVYGVLYALSLALA